MDGIANHFPAQNALDCRILHTISIFFPGVIPSDPQKRPWCFDPDTISFCLAHQRSHCSCFTKRPLVKLPDKKRQAIDHGTDVNGVNPVRCKTHVICLTSDDPLASCYEPRGYQYQHCIIIVTYLRRLCSTGTEIARGFPFRRRSSERTW